MGGVLALRRLPPRVALFHLRARRLAARSGHDWALEAATTPGDLAILIGLAAGRQRIAELGTGPGWTAIALALAQAQSQVVTFDPVAHEHRHAYLSLVGPSVRRRISFLELAGELGAAQARPVDMLFIDSTHQRQPTVAEFRAWRSRLRPGALVAFHDYGHPDFPGVEQAVGQLGLSGEVRGGLFVWRMGRA